MIITTTTETPPHLHTNNKPTHKHSGFEITTTTSKGKCLRVEKKTTTFRTVISLYLEQQQQQQLKILVILTRKDHEKLHFYDFIDADIIITSHQFLMNFKYYPCLHYRNITPSTFNATHRNNALKQYYKDNIIILELKLLRLMFLFFF